MNQLAAALSDDDAAPAGSLLMLRLADLTGLNRRNGRESADEVLRRVGQMLAQVTGTHPEAAAARLNGADFALLLPGVQDPAEQAEKLLHALNDLSAAGLLDTANISATLPARPTCTARRQALCWLASTPRWPQRKPGAGWPGARPTAIVRNLPPRMPTGNACSMAPYKPSACG